jgi:hypothetical protein
VPPVCSTLCGRMSGRLWRGSIGRLGACFCCCGPLLACVVVGPGVFFVSSSSVTQQSLYGTWLQPLAAAAAAAAACSGPEQHQIHCGI